MQKIDNDKAKRESEFPSGSVACFDQLADTYFQAYEEPTPGGRACRVRKRNVIELFDKPGGRVLDIGCGPGVMVEEMLASGCEFWGLDGSVRMIEQCHKNFPRRPRAHFSVADATALPFPDEFFDAVISMGVIDRIQAHELALTEMVRVLKRGGTLIITVPNLLSPWAFWRNFVFNAGVAFLRPVYYGLTQKPRRPTMAPFARLHRAAKYTRLVAGQGCQVLNVSYFNFNLLLSPLDDLFPGLAIRIADRAESLRSGKLQWLGGGFIVKARKRDNGVSI